MEATTAPSAGDGLMAPSETGASDVRVRGAEALQPPPVISDGGVKEECYDACTDDEQVARDASRMAVATKKEEGVDTDDESHQQTSRGTDGAFLKRLEELKAYKVKHGHVNVKESEDKSLARFCVHIRHARRYPESSKPMKTTEQRVASLDALGFEWGTERARSKTMSFQERLEELKAYKAKHGHTNVKKSEDNSLYKFCWNMRHAHRNPESSATKLTVERIASLEALGFNWRFARAAQSTKGYNSFQERVEELKTYKATHGHINVKVGEDKSLYHFCTHIRRAREGRGAMKMTEDRIASLDALGFEWLKQNDKYDKIFQAWIKELKAYKAEHGHVNVKQSEDKRLAGFCKDIRGARRGFGKTKLTEERIASLNDLGFDWAPESNMNDKSFLRRLEELKAYKAKHGHLHVIESEDKSLYGFCANIRYARRHPERSAMKLDEERTASLDALGFNWEPRKVKVKP